MSSSNFDFQTRMRRVIEVEKKFADAVSAEVDQRVEKLSAKLLPSLMKYYATIEETSHQNEAQVARWRHAHAQQSAAAQHSFYLALLAAHVRRETRGVVELQPLREGHNNPALIAEYNRCKKAVLEAADKNMFKEDPTSASLVVMDIWKIANRRQSCAFSQKTSNVPQSLIKGLFLHLPVKCLEHALVFGCEAPTPQLYLEMFGCEWLSEGSGGGDEEEEDEEEPSGWSSSSSSSHVRKFLQQGHPLPACPTFSKFSTMGWRRGNDDDDKNDIYFGVGEASGRPHPHSRPRPHSHPHRRPGPTYLLLSRVLLGKMFEVKDRTCLEGGEPPDGFDSVFIASTQEYVLKEPAVFLPEFLIQTDYAPRKETVDCTQDQVIHCRDKTEEQLGIQAGEALGEIAEEIHACTRDVLSKIPQRALKQLQMLECRDQEIEKAKMELQHAESELRRQKQNSEQLIQLFDNSLDIIGDINSSR